MVMDGGVRWWVVGGHDRISKTRSKLRSGRGQGQG